ncbi:MULTISPECIES: chromosome segregation protein SMC [Pseudonocardia]|uniref:Chromosome partition protein Smc n=2 Tax=Pseudonocardia TaxID=1847 RepID=A0A1Y2N183_PSEAH|nr:MULTISPECIES: chromosome segregation protein SMC [Pseudonocardia]OSY41200.1 Chromosome partition protein Smc [Pseudonocardia autotrophica]TDN76656.1 condensin subunit Smc [Pseudonocardia autotrophica]BBG00656.1 chromosome partition protein Smc [Pseudonocardia autotrophica]GEC27990.1 chromosome partition protein Smc [Pseudonocardia saturnea]
MHLKTLTMKGFKSFASATTLRLEPGITCVVGPNGSGKSNVVDAISWVLGEQGAKALRGGKMEDVIFAGTSGRAPLGRAEVTLTIDNSDGALPIDYSEVSVTRRMFRDGAGEYEINGSRARLLDVQELLSDSGIGREMHVIVGQGQLDGVLQSKPEDRRAYIEEAAGVLKHRKRKEKALRKLDAMQANLTRLTDLTAELRRQLKPLGRQAEIARRAQSVQTELRDARLRLSADDLVTLQGEVAREEAGQEQARRRRAEVEEQLTGARESEQELAAALAQDAPRLAAAQDTWYQLSALAERLRGTVRLAQERVRHLTSSEAAERTPGRDPDETEAEADAIAEQEEELVDAVAQARRRLDEVIAEKAERERTLAAAEREHMAAVRALADRRAGIATLAGKADALRSGAAATAEEIERLSEALTEAAGRTEAARAELESAREELGIESGDGEDALAVRVEQAEAAHRAAAERVAELVRAERDAEQRRAHWRARVDALGVGLVRRDGTGALLDSAPDGLLGAVAELVVVEPAGRAAVAAALGEVAEGVAVASVPSAAAALRALRTGDSGRAALLVGGDGAADGPPARIAVPDGDPPAGRWAAGFVTAPPALGAALAALLRDVVVVDDLDSAAAALAARPGLTAVTTDGDLLTAHAARGGAGAGEGALQLQAAVDDAVAERDRVDSELESLRPTAEGARAEEQARAADLQQARSAVAEAEKRRSAAAAQLGRLEQVVTSAGAEAQRLRERRDAVEARRSESLIELEAAEHQLSIAEDVPVDDEPDTELRDEAAERVEEVRSEEVECRLALRTAEERASAIAGRAESLRRQAQAERQARARAAAAAQERERAGEIARLVVDAGELAVSRIEVSLAAAAAERDEIQAARADRDRAHREARDATTRLTALLEKLTDAVHRDEMVRQQTRMRLEQLTERVLADHGIGIDDLVGEYGPDVPVPASEAETAEYEAARERGEQVSAPPPVPFDRATQERRLKRAEKDLAQLGKVNPLALEEFAALEERYRFLSTQLEDLKNTRRDLLTVVREVDDKILQVFTTAYHDVAREFEIVFATLFPGGDGRLVLTDPEDMLTTGIEVEARPPGKKVKRLSLLSGGERSLTAMALLVAIFRARPSPFYVLDEIEAALDDVNLRRLISLLEELRAASQLIVITHQKPTMEVADALYGVSMRGDGITQVISQRLRPAS